MQYSFGQPLSGPDKPANQSVYDGDCQEYAEDISCYPPLPSGWVEEVVRVKSLGSLGYIRKSEVESEDKEKDSYMQRWWNIGTRKEDFE